MADRDPLAEDLRQQVHRLPRFSRLVLRFLETARRENASAGAFARILAGDDLLAAWVLRQANSGFFHLARPVTTLGEALVVIGLAPLTRMVYAACTRDLLRYSPRAYLYPGQGFWRHALATASIARELATRTGTAEHLLPDEAFVAGLIHDLGKRVLDPHLPAGAGPRSLSPTEERAAAGVDHAGIGAQLCRVWGLPAQVAGPVAGHHDPGERPGDCVVALADALANHWGLGPRMYADLARPLPPAAWRSLRGPLGLSAAGLAETAAALLPLLEELDAMLRLLGTQPPPPPRADAVDTATAIAPPPQPAASRRRQPRSGAERRRLQRERTRRRGRR